MYLNCHSFHSLRYGTISLSELVKQAVDAGVKALALTDINTVTGIYDFTKECLANDIKPLVGMEFRKENDLRFITIVKNQSGIGEICRLRTTHNFGETSLPFSAPDFQNVFVIYPLENLPENLKEHEFIGIRSEQLPSLFHKKWSGKLNKMVMLQPITFSSEKEFELHKVLRAIDENVILSKLDDKQHCSDSEKMMPLQELLDLYRHYPQIIENTRALIDACNFEFQFETPRNRKFYTKSRQADMKLLTSLAEQGLVRKYGTKNKAARARMEKELKVIEDLEFSGYFLITWDIIRYSNSMGFMHIGRGSGANSIIAYCLGITDICPLELDLYFERFLNINRKSPPDFDRIPCYAGPSAPPEMR